MRRVIWWFIVSLIAFTSIFGLSNGFRDWFDTNGLGEQMVAAAVICYGITGAIVVFAMLSKRKWLMIPLILWSLAIAFAAVAAPLVYSPAEATWVGAAASGICTIALLTLIALQVRKEASSW